MWPSDEEYIFDLTVVPSLEDYCVNEVEDGIGSHGLDNNIHDLFENEYDDIFRGELISFNEAGESIQCIMCIRSKWVFFLFF